MRDGDNSPGNFVDDRPHFAEEIANSAPARCSKTKADNGLDATPRPGV
jgi:hypothetical protein